ncbi:SusC/RagA family TonB-linked outer membrane protein [Cnuella takakiae]|nr:SusC/RagA family TonB-linked outer membrane protein [Cnuella takakiae]
MLRNRQLKTTLLMVLALFCWLADAQAKDNYKERDHKGNFAIPITGQVVDSSGQPLQGVSVSIAGTTVGTVTDANGRYNLNVPDNYASRSLTFSYTGYTSQVIAIGTQREINITLANSAGTLLSDVVVVGYGTQRRGSLTGSVNQISSKSIENKPVTNTLQALQGESPNLIIQQRDFNPGSGVNINIRGLGTLGDNTPLIVIDGIVGGNINTINPNDIESVSVLKDAGSAAIYGSRAANGVLLVTTKSGRRNQKATIAYNGNVGLQEPRVLVKKVSAWDNAYYKNLSLINSGLQPIYTPQDIQNLKAQGNGTWDIEHLLKNALFQTHNLSISGGGENSSYFISGGYQNQGSNFIGNGGSGAGFGYQKYNLRLNQTTIAGRFRANVILNYTKTRNKTNSVGDNNIFADANRVPLNYSWKDSAGNYLTNPVASQYNEYGVLEKGGYNQSDVDEIFANLNGQLTITKDLKLTGVFGGTIFNGNNFYRRIQVDFLPAGVYGNDRAVSDNNFKNLQLNTQLYAEYTKTLNQHYFKVLLGGSNENYTGRGFSIERTLTDRFLGTPTTGTLITPGNSNNSVGVDATSLSSFFGRVNYSYKNKYLLEGNFREDFSSKFAKANRAAFFPSISAGWLLSQEPFMDRINRSVNNLKLRVSYGSLGNQSVGSYQYQSTYFNYQSAYAFGGNVVGGAGFRQGNPDITWETATTFNAGLDAGLLNNKLTFSFDYFNKVTDNILQPREDVPAIYGAGFPAFNIAKVKNSGYEFTLNYNLNKRVASHIFSFNFADNNNELLRLNSAKAEEIRNQDVFSLIRRVGSPITQYYGYQVAGIFQNTEEIARSAKPAGADVAPGDLKFKDLNNDGRIDDGDKTVLGNPFPRYTFGFTYRLAVKGFDVQIFAQGVGKRDAFLRGELVEPFHYNYGQTIYEHMTDSWTPANPNARYPRFANIGSASNNNNWRTGSDIYKYDAAYIRLKNVNIGYTLPAAMTQKWGMQRLRASLIGQNLLTLSKLSFIDPETSEFGNDLNLGSSSNSARSYPLPVFYGVGLDITF